MPNVSAENWIEIQKLHDAGLNLIPVRDIDTGTAKAKTPFRDWAKYRTEKLSAADLFSQMEDHNTSAVAVVCGAISGNLENIDIDVKHKAGIDALIFSDLNKMYPALFDSLAIDRTPSGGYHLLYTISDPQPDSMRSYNLASRPATEAELKEFPKRKTYCFIELKSEGGLSQMPPSPGYSIYQQRPIPCISWNDRCSIINLMRSYDQIPIIEKPYKETKQDIDYYDENPFEHFNGSDKAENILTDHGWKPYRSANNTFLYFTHPESKEGGVHASFNKKTRIYRIFTSSSEFDPDKMYNAATVLSILLHNGDKKRTFAYLVQQGFGKIKPYKEQQIVKKYAINKKPLPPNASADAIALHTAISAKMVQVHPHGIFWVEDYEKGLSIDRMLIYNVSEGLGFRLHNEKLVRIVDNIIHEQTEREYFDVLKNYIKEEDEDSYKDIVNAYESFIERHGKFTINRLKILVPEQILNDTRTDCYKFYSNGMLHITRDGYELKPIPTDKIIWNRSIQPREFFEHDGGLYVDFLDKAIGLTPYLLSCIGYLAHDFKDDTAGYIIVLSEQCINPKDGGGSGKNIFSKLFEHITTFFSRAGSQVKYDEKFMQAWNYQKIYAIADVLKSFNFEFLKEFTQGSATMKKLHVNEYSIPSSEMPKFLISTNFSYEVKDGGIKRRIRPIEFTDFFTKTGGVDVHYKGIHFSDNWSKEDWGGYDTTMALAIQAWLNNDRKLPVSELTESGWHKQFEQSYGRTVNGIINENWEEWRASIFVSNETFKNDCQRYYDDNGVMAKYRPSSFAFNEALTEWCKKHGYDYKKEAVERQGPITVKGKEFKNVT